MKITKKRKLYENRRNRADDEGVDARQFPIGTGRRSIGGMYNRLGRGDSDASGKTVSKGAQFYKALDKWGKNISSGVEGKNLRDKFLNELRIMADKKGFESLLSVLDGTQEIKIMIYKTVKDGLGTKQVGKPTPMSISDLIDKGAFGFSDGASAKVEELKDIIQGFMSEEAPTNEGKTKMKITKRTLQKLIKEELQKVLRENIDSAFGPIGGTSSPELYALTNYSGRPMTNVYSSMEDAEKWAKIFNQDALDEGSILDAYPLEIQDLQVDPTSGTGVLYGVFNNSSVDLPGASAGKARGVVRLAGLYGSVEEADEAFEKILSNFKTGTPDGSFEPLVDDSGKFRTGDHAEYYSLIEESLEIVKIKVMPKGYSGKSINESRRRRRRRK